MQLFGILSILITFALIFWWFSLSASPESAAESEASRRSQYVEALESAEAASELLSQ